jgi:hypothetical protein
LCASAYLGLLWPLTLLAPDLLGQEPVVPGSGVQEKSAAPAGVALNALAQEIKEAGLDPETCFRVRDFQYRRGEARFYFTDGILIFRKPVRGLRTAAVFVAAEDVGDAEVLLIPPNKMERRSLSAFTQAPNLDEHFGVAAFLFSDGTGERWLEQLRAIEANPGSNGGTAIRSPDRGLLLAEKWNQTVRNLGASLEPRFLEDLSNSAGAKNGLFFAAISGKTLGNFDLYFDPRGSEELMVGQLVTEGERRRYNFWTHFEPKTRPGGTARPSPEPPLIIERYRVEAEIGDDLRLHAKVKISLRAREKNVRVVPLTLSPLLEVKSARWNGQEREVYQRDALRAALLRANSVESVLVGLEQVLAEGERGELEIEEEGAVFRPAGNGVLYLSTRANWYPQMSMQAAPFEAVFLHNKTLTLVCPGQRSERIVGERKETKCTVENPVRLFGFNLGELVSNSVKRGNYEVEVFANKRLETALERMPQAILFSPPPVGPGMGRQRRVEFPALIPATPPASPLARVPEMTDDIAGALEYMAGLLGPPAMNKLVAAPIPGAFGQGFPGFLYLSTLAYLEDRAMPAPERAEWQNRYFRDLLQAHEVAHQWWGNLVSFDSYKDEWLAEALANYSALLYLEKRRGPKAVETVLESYKQRLLISGQDGKALENAGPVVFGMRLQYSNPEAWRAVTYDKGTWILHMLRGRLGDAAFLKMLGQLAREFHARPMRSDDLRRIAASYLPADAPDRQMENFFETWVYGVGVPTLELSSSVKGVAPKARVLLTLKQSGVGEDFAVDVPVEITLPRGQKIVRWIRSSEGEETLEVPTGAAPLKVQLDPHWLVLRR